MNLIDILLAAAPLALVAVGAVLFFVGWLLGGAKSRLFYTVVIVTALAGFLSQVSLGVGYLRAGGVRTPEASLYTWSPVGDAGFGVTVAFRGDLLSYLFALPLTALTLLTVIYLLVRRPLAEAQDGIVPGRLFGLIFLAEGAGLGAFYSADFVMTFFWLEGVSLALYLLSGPGLRGASAGPASYRALAVNFMAGQLIFAPLLVMISRNGGRSSYTDFIPAVLDNVLLSLLVAGCLIKAAQFPFQAWLGSFEDLPGAANGLLSAGFIFPFAVYLPVRLQSLAASRLDLFAEVSWLLLPVGAFTVLFGAIAALRMSGNFGARLGLLTAAQFGFVAIALGLGDLPAAFQQLIGLVIGAPLLFLCADQLAIENAEPPNPARRVHPKPLSRPAAFRPLLVTTYAIGAFNFAGLPLSPVYAARWQTLTTLLNEGYRFYLGLAVIGAVVMLPALAHGLLVFMNGPRRTAEGRGEESYWTLGGLLVLAGLSVGLGFYPALAGSWINTAVGRVQPAAPASVNAGTAGGWLGFLLVLGLVVGFFFFWLGRRGLAIASFNGGLTYGLQNGPVKVGWARTGRSKMALKKIEPEEEIPEGFEDEFFTSAFRPNKPKVALRRPLPDPRLTPADYFGPLNERLKEVFKVFDTSYSGGFLAGLLLRILDFVRRVFEWTVERFYPALAAFILIVFVILLTR